MDAWVAVIGVPVDLMYLQIPTQIYLYQLRVMKREREQDYEKSSSILL